MIAALSVAAVLALAPSAEAGFKGRFAERFGYPTKRDNRPRNTGFKYKRTVQRSSAKCHAVAYSKSFQTYKDAHVHAGAPHSAATLVLLSRRHSAEWRCVHARAVLPVAGPCSRLAAHSSPAHLCSEVCVGVRLLQQGGQVLLGRHLQAR